MKFTHSKRVIPGFGLTMGVTIAMLSLLILIPLASVFVYAFRMSGAEFLETVTNSAVLYAFRTSIICALLAAAGEVLYLVRAGAEGRMAFACLFILMEVAGGLMMLAFRKKIMDTAFEKTGHH